MQPQPLVFTLDLPGIPVSALRAFHHSPQAIAQLTPPGTLKKLTGDLGPLHEGQRLVLYVKKFGLTLPWHAINENISPEGFTDRQLKGPFAFWQHRHHFVDLGSWGCQLVDAIQYQLPLHPLSLWATPFIERDVKNLFSFRHERTQKLLSTQSPTA